MRSIFTGSAMVLWMGLGLLLLAAGAASGEDAANIYGIHDHSPSPQPWLDRVTSGGAKGWVTATVAVGHNPSHTGGDDFRSISNQGHTVICRINNGYCPDGSIPIPSEYDNFATRVANYVKNTKGCDLFIIGNETNLPVEWPLNQSSALVTPQMYATCFIKCYQKIKLLRPEARVVPQALAPWAAQFGSGTVCGYPHNGMSLSWVDYMNQMLTAIRDGGAGPDGVATHVNSRGYTYGDIHSTAQIYFGGKYLYWSFYSYMDWINYGIPQDLYHLPVYITECNGMYYWKGGHPECTNYDDPRCTYQAGWMQEIYAEINRWNTVEGPQGKPVIKCVNMYRWCSWCDAWNIDGAPKEALMMTDLSAAVAQNYKWADGIVIIEEHGYIGDFDEDNDVDQADFGLLQQCFTGTGNPILNPDCDIVNLDEDHDIDDVDYAVFEACMSGSNVEPPLQCYY